MKMIFIFILEAAPCQTNKKDGFAFIVYARMLGKIKMVFIL